MGHSPAALPVVGTEEAPALFGGGLADLVAQLALGQELRFFCTHRNPKLERAGASALTGNRRTASRPRSSGTFWSGWTS
ncbi:unnamed protein product, partial [Ixodes pacificus]